jgi:hypothetical protein
VGDEILLRELRHLLVDDRARRTSPPS